MSFSNTTPAKGANYNPLNKIYVLKVIPKEDEIPTDRPHGDLNDFINSDCLNVSLPNGHVPANQTSKTIPHSKDSKSKCMVCDKRLGLSDAVTGKCKCEKLFCNKHRIPKAHECTFDYKGLNQEQLKKKNVGIGETKLNKI